MRHADRDVLHQLHLGLGRRIDERGIAAREHRDHQRARQLRRLRQLLPDLLGDVRRERVEQPHRGLERGREHALHDVAARAPSPLRPARRSGALVQVRLGELDVPVAQLVPHEVVDRVRRVAEPERLERGVDLAGDRLQARQDPALRHAERGAPRRASRAGPRTAPGRSRRGSSARTATRSTAC